MLSNITIEVRRSNGTQISSRQRSIIYAKFNNTNAKILVTFYPIPPPLNFLPEGHISTINEKIINAFLFIPTPQYIILLFKIWFIKHLS